ncbi:hypothetical protein C2E23DRAFT_936755 [Lenzites betulinus]|nr:hypothetical protein C2E23DRAFT_936755 [Lenzites betulinus]
MDKSLVDALNWDVLLHLATFLPRHDLSQLSKTCHALYEASIRELLHDAVELRADNILSFHACLLGDATSRRAGLVRELVLNCSLSHPRPTHTSGRKATSEALKTLTGILKSTRNLKKLQLDWAAAGLSSYLHHAELRIPFISRKLWRDLWALQAPLRKASLRFGPMRGSPVANPIPLLARFSATLEEVSLSNVQFANGTVQYPRVRKLSLSDSYVDFLLGAIDSAPVVSAFPNVVDLSFAAARSHPEISQWLEGRVSDKPELIQRCRRSNKHAHSQGLYWSKLERVVVGHVMDLYMLGLEQHVPRVEIEMLSASTLYMLQDVLRDTRPSSLSLSLFAVDSVLDCIPCLFKPGTVATEGLSDFELTLRCMRPSIDTDKLVTNLSILLGLLRVERFTLRLRRWDTVGVYYLPKEELLPIDACLDRIYVQAGDLIMRLIGDIPSIREAALFVGDRIVEWKATTPAEAPCR